MEGQFGAASWDVECQSRNFFRWNRPDSRFVDFLRWFPVSYPFNVAFLSPPEIEVI